MKKKKGSSLIFVLVTFAVITIFGVSVLSLTLVSYKKRLVDTTEKRNQYFSESGIDIAYGVIGKTVDTAVKEGNEALEAEIVKLQDPTKAAELTDQDKEYLNADGSINEDAIKRNVFLAEYKSYILANIKSNIESNDYAVENNNADKPVVTVKNDSLSFDSNNILTLNLESKFSSTSKSNPSGPKEVNKTIQVTYKIGPAQYDKPISVTTVAVPLDLPWEKKVICANGNLTMKSTYKVTGDIYAKGDTNGGIDIQGGGSEVNGIIATGENFNMSSSATVNGNIYAGNITVDNGASLNVKSYTDSNGNKLFGSIYTNNDLELGNATVSINSGFYGLKEDPGDVTYSGSSKPPVSSSILINDSSGTSITIQKQVVLVGVGYIKTSPDQYHTGESVAIKGNYEAYTQPLKNDNLNKGVYKEGNVEFEYMSPLTLVKGIKNIVGEMSLDDRDKYIRSYVQEKNEEKGNNDTSSLDGVFSNNILSNINLPDPTKPDSVLTIGAYVSNGHIYGGKYTVEQVNENFLKNKRVKYSEAVYSMTPIYDTLEEDHFDFLGSINEDAFDNYMNNEDKDISKNTTIPYVPGRKGLFDFTKITQNVKDTIDLGSKGKYVVYFNGDGKDCYVIGDGASSSVEPIDTINLSTNQGVTGAFIVTKGNVHIAGAINNANCTIISGSNVIDEDTASKTLNKNPCVKELMAKAIQKYSFLNGVFKGTNEENIEIPVDNVVENNVGTDIIRDAKQITMQSWRILK